MKQNSRFSFAEKVFVADKYNDHGKCNQPFFPKKCHKILVGVHYKFRHEKTDERNNNE